LNAPINPWEEHLRDIPGWETLDLGEDGPVVKRLKVPGGWLYLVGKHPPTYVPE